MTRDRAGERPAAAGERSRLDSIAADSWYSKGLNTASMLYSARVFARHWKGPRCLELGPAEGIMTEVLADAFSDLTVVEGAKRFCDDLARKHPKADVVCSIFEDYHPTRQFETVVLGHVLEHVEDPRGLLRRVRTWLAPGGVVCAAVPNARSLHRQAAVMMGLLPTEHSMNETDVHHGHRRVYDPDSFRADVTAAGLSIRTFGGYWMKPLANAQLEATWTPAMLDAFMELGERYPEIAGVIYVIAGA